METKSNQQIADRIERWANRWGYDVHSHYANTGTIYLVIGDWKIRIANHADAYATSDYTIDGVEGSPNGAIAWLAKKLGQPVPPQIKAAMGRATQKVNQAKLDENQRLEQYAAQKKRATDTWQNALAAVREMADQGDEVALDRLERFAVALDNTGRKWSKKRQALRGQILDMATNRNNDRYERENEDEGKIYR